MALLTAQTPTSSAGLAPVLGAANSPDTFNTFGPGVFLIVETSNAATLTITPLTTVPLVVLPSTASVYANQPVTLTILGGAGPYQAFTSNGAVLPVIRNVVGDQVVLAPANVDADTNGHCASSSRMGSMS